MSEAEAAAVDVMEGSAEPVQRRKSVATPNQVLAIVCVGICLANLDLFIVNVGLPNIARDFRVAGPAVPVVRGRILTAGRRGRS